MTGDGVNGSNATLILRTCRSDGVLLKADVPATPTDAWWMRTLTDTTASACKGDFSVTHTSFAVTNGARLDHFTWLCAHATLLCRIVFFQVVLVWLR